MLIKLDVYREITRYKVTHELLLYTSDFEAELNYYAGELLRLEKLNGFPGRTYRRKIEATPALCQEQF